jgi:hypothetical protein
MSISGGICRKNNSVKSVHHHYIQELNSATSEPPAKFDSVDNRVQRNSLHQCVTVYNYPYRLNWPLILV